jgi:hypothetical protein
MFSGFLDPFSKVVPNRSIKAGMVIQKAVFKMKVAKSGCSSFKIFIFTRSSAKGCSWIDLSKAEMVIQTHCLKMKIASQWMLQFQRLFLD